MKKAFHAVLDYFKKTDSLLLLVCCLATAYGIVLISSATASYETMRYVYIQLAALGIGVLLFILVSLIDLDIIGDKWYILLAFNFLCIASLFLFGVAGDSGNRSWIRFAGIGIQPAEIVKITFIILLAKQMTFLKEYRNLNAFFSVAQLTVHFAATFLLIILASDDWGSALVYLFIFIFVLFAGGIKLRWFALGLGVLAAATPILWNFVLRDDQKLRIMALYDNSIDPEGLGVTWQTSRSKIAIASGQLTGQGLYNGTQTQSSYLPAKHTDFIFSVAGEELGLIGCIAIILLLTVIIARCIYVGVKSHDTMGFLVCMGVAGMLIFQTFENIGMCLDITPVIGLTLPFFSYGGSSIITLFAAMGLVAGVRMRTRNQPR